MTDSCCGPSRDGQEALTTRVLYWYILETFLRRGREPTLADMERDLHFRRDAIARMLTSLEKKGAVRLDPLTSRIMDAYPYSAVPTRHQASLMNGKRVFCMCAIDVFYLPFLTGNHVEVRSRCYECRAEIQISIGVESISGVKPPTAVLWYSAAAYDCPKTNFFCSEEHLRQWQDRAPEESGQACTLAEALERGRKAGQRFQETKAGLNEILWATADELVCYCREVPKAAIVNAVARGARSVEQVAAVTTACTGRWCKEVNPRQRCCSAEIEALVECYSGGSISSSEDGARDDCGCGPG